MKAISLVPLIVFVFLLAGCQAGGNKNTNDAARILDAAQAKITDHATHRYRYVSFWDNRFARSTYADSMRITYTRLADSDRGFAFLAAGPDYEVLYDGKDYLKIDHQKRKVIRTRAAEIAEKEDFFDHKMYFRANPRELPRFADFDRAIDTIVAGKDLFAYYWSAATDGASGPITNARTFFIDPATTLLVRIHNASVQGGDTTQIVDYRLDGHSFAAEPYRFSASDREASLGYREVSTSAAKAERLAGLVRPGNQLSRPDYTDIESREQLIYGTPGEKSVIMFSFIGCGACEYALREMKKRDYRTQADLAFHYSSPVDKASSLRGYLQKKDFPHLAFGKDSRMNDNFHAAAFPTFVFIGATGEVEHVLGGYDAQVEDLLFGE